MGKRKRSGKNKQGEQKSKPTENNLTEGRTSLVNLSAASLLGPAPNSLPRTSATPERKISRPPSAGSAPQQYLDPKVKMVSEILKNPPPIGVDAALDQTGLRVTPGFVVDVLKASYVAGMEAVRFFRWAGWQLGNKHSPYAWNLLVDLLGTNKLFDAMWDTIKAMKSEGILSVGTFSSVFTNYVLADKVEEAVMTFEVMEQYGCKQDIVAFNSLICALCRYSHTLKALEIFERVKEKIIPDADSYALLLEGWEREGDIFKARHTFGEMIIRIGWKPSNTAAYTAFLNTLFNGNQVDEAMKFLHVMKGRQCIPDVKFFRRALKTLYQNKNAKDAFSIWETMLENGLPLDTATYDAMIGVFCLAGQIDSAYRLLDEMVFNGVFPDSQTYNIFFQALLRARKVPEASSIFREMTKNECHPVYASYVMAIKMYFEADDPEMATMMWRHMILKGVVPKEDCASALINGFCELGRLSEARKYLEESVARGIQVPSETLAKLKSALIRAGKRDAVESLQRRIKGF